MTITVELTASGIPVLLPISTWAEWYDDVLPQVPGCDEAMATFAIRESAREFCFISKALQQDLPLIDVVAGQAAYPLTPNSELEPVEIIEARFNGAHITPAQIRNLPKGYASMSGQVCHYWCPDVGQIRLYKIPDAPAVDGLAITLAIKPTKNSTGIPRPFFKEYEDAIANGAIARLMMTPKKPYTNLGLGADYKRNFNSDALYAATRSALNFTRGPMRTKMRF